MLNMRRTFYIDVIFSVHFPLLQYSSNYQLSLIIIVNSEISHFNDFFTRH